MPEAAPPIAKPVGAAPQSAEVHPAVGFTDGAYGTDGVVGAVRTVSPAPVPQPATDAAAAVQRSWGLSSITGAISSGVSAVAGGVRAVASGVAGGVASIASGVKDRVLGTLAGWARRMPGYELLCTVLGRDVVAGTPVPRSATAIISGFLGLIPGGGTMRQNLQESGAIDRAGAWFETEIPKLGLTWEAIRGLFQRAWDGLGASDLLDPAGAWQRIAGIFGPPLARLRDFAVAAGGKVLEFIFEGALSMAGGLGTQVMAVVRRAGGVVTQIFRDPIGFAGNLVAAVRGGLGQFLTNITGHLRTGLFGWLMGALRGAIRLPAQFDLRGILSMAIEFLGLTWENLRGRLVRMIGAERVALLERGVAVVQDLATRGLSAITDRIAGFTSGLLDTVIGGIREWVANSVVGAAITRLISMFNPAGAVIQAIIAVYNTVKFFVERAQQLGALANSVFDSIGAIATGSIGAAKNAVEQAMGRTVPVVLGFLSRLIGLGDIATPVRNVVNRVRGVIDGALDRVVGWLAGMARRARGGASEGVPATARGGMSPHSAVGVHALNQPLRVPVSMRGAAHTLTVTPSGEVRLASVEGAIAEKLRRATSSLTGRDPETEAELNALVRIETAEQCLLGAFRDFDIHPTDATRSVFDQAVRNLKGELQRYAVQFNRTDIESITREVTVAQALRWSEHIPPAAYWGGKHWSGRSEIERRRRSLRASQFVFSLNAEDVMALERDTLLTGEITRGVAGTFHAYKQYPQQLGWDRDRPAHWLRAELTGVADVENPQGQIHSHPRAKR